MRTTLLLLLALAGCATPDRLYVAADRATYEAVAPSWSAYISVDPSLTAQQRARRLTLIETWRQRIEAAEGATR